MLEQQMVFVPRMMQSRTTTPTLQIWKILGEQRFGRKGSSLAFGWFYFYCFNSGSSVKFLPLFGFDGTVVVDFRTPKRHNPTDLRGGSQTSMWNIASIQRSSTTLRISFLSLEKGSERWHLSANCRSSS